MASNQDEHHERPIGKSQSTAGGSAETEGIENPGPAEAYAELAKPEIDLIKEARQKQEERKQKKAAAEKRLQEATEAGDAPAADAAREEVQDLEELLLISEGKVTYGDEPPPSAPSL